MHPKKYLFCSVLPVFLAFQLWPSISKTETLSDKIKRFVQGEADTVFSFSPETRNYVFFNAGYSLVIREKDTLRKGLNPKFTLIDFNGKMIWDTTLKSWSDCELTSDKIASPKVVIRRWLGEGMGATEIFNVNGNRLAKVEEVSILRVSPGGIYFYSIPSGMETNNLNIYDSLGTRFWSDTTRSEFGLAVPFTDSLLFYEAWRKVDESFMPELFILNPKNNKSKLDLTGDTMVPPSSLGSVSVAQNGQFFALYGNPYLYQPTIQFFTLKGSLLWEATFGKANERVFEAVLSPNGKFLAALILHKEKPKSQEIQFRDNLAKGRLIWKIEAEKEALLVSSPWSSIAVFDSMMTVIQPAGYEYFRNRGLTSATKTKCIFYLPTNGSVVDSFTTGGFLTKSDSRIFGTHYFQAIYDERSQKIFVLRSR